MHQRLANKVALITGAAHGIGQAVAQRFLAEGAKLVVFDRDPQALAQAFSSDQAVLCVGDVRSATDNQQAVSLALQHYGKLDVLVANAGIYDNRQSLLSYDAATLDATFDELFAVNVKGYLLAAHAAATALADQQGSMILTGSISGSHAGFGGPLYVAAKHAVHGLTKQLALELAPHVRVNAIAPGYVPTQLGTPVSLGPQATGSGPTPDSRPLHSIPGPDAYASAYVYLASDESRHTATGSILALDGGTAIRGPRP